MRWRAFRGRRASQAGFARQGVAPTRTGAGLPEGSYGIIPGFYGAEADVARHSATGVWHKACTVMANPDWAQLPIR